MALNLLFFNSKVWKKYSLRNLLKWKKCTQIGVNADFIGIDVEWEKFVLNMTYDNLATFLYVVKFTMS